MSANSRSIRKNHYGDITVCNWEWPSRIFTIKYQPICYFIRSRIGINKLFYLISRIKKYITIHQLECFEFVSLDTLLCLPTPKTEIIATSWKTTIHISWKWSTTHWMEQGWPRTNNSTITIYAYTHTYT